MSILFRQRLEAHNIGQGILPRMQGSAFSQSSERASGAGAGGDEAGSVFRRADGVCGAAVQRGENLILAPQRFCALAQGHRKPPEVSLAAAARAIGSDTER